VLRCHASACRDDRQEGRHLLLFVTDGIEAALHRAQEAAGSQDVRVNGGADVARQYLNAGLLDEVRLHLVPVVLGAGTRLFDGARSDVGLVAREAVSTPLATHLTYDVERAAGSDRR
jgi:dihydrofolate reductase